MKRNEKILAGALGVMVAGYFAWPVVDGIYFAPIRDRDETVALLETQNKEKEYANTDLRIAQQRVIEWKRDSLPGDPLDAQRLYQQWLMDLAAASGLDVVVTPSSRIPGGGIYTRIPVELKGKATFSELQRFLRRLEEVDLLHRVSQLKISAPTSAEGDPELPFALTAEGLNVAGAPDRARLFPQFELAKPLEADAGEIEITRKEFPAKVGDRIRIGNEFVEVTEAADDRLKLKRGTDGTIAAEHSSGSIAELFPIDREVDPESIAAFASVKSPFVKPRKYQPHFEGFVDQRLLRGTPLKMTVKVSDYEQSAGTAPIEFVDGPEGMNFDPARGELTWTPPVGLETGDYAVTLTAKVPEPEQVLKQTIRITIADPNTPPKFEAIATASVFLGETLRLPLSASDAENGESLAFSVEQGPPGATVDASKKEFVWGVPMTDSPGEVSVTLVATDKGEPAMSSKQTFTIKVSENLKPFVRLTGATARGNDRQAQIWDQSSGKAYYAREGSTIEAAGVTMLVKEIGRDYITYERNGETWKIQLGQHLDQAEKISGPLAEVSNVDQPVEASRPAKTAPAATAGKPAPAF